MTPDIAEICAAGEAAFSKDEFEEAEIWYELACTGIVYKDPHPRRNTRNDHLVERRFERYDELRRRRYGGFVYDQFTKNIATWERDVVPALRGREQVNFLEIGCLEGRASTWIMENICTRNADRLTCLDLFSTRFEPIWDKNMLPFRERVIKLKTPSYVGLRPLPFGHFDTIYIDGSHADHDVLRDAVLCWDLLKVGGLLIFDDYLWVSAVYRERPQSTINAFLEAFAGQYRLVSKGWQVIIERVR